MIGVLPDYFKEMMVLGAFVRESTEYVLAGHKQANHYRHARKFYALDYTAGGIHDLCRRSRISRGFPTKGIRLISVVEIAA